MTNDERESLGMLLHLRGDGGVTLRDARPEDEALLAAIRAGEYGRYFGDAAAGDAAFVVAEDGAALLGFALVYVVAGKKSHTPKLSDVYVGERHRRRGVASALVAECERRARRAGFGEIFVSVEPSNEAMHSLLRGCGYEQVSEAPYAATTPEGVRYMRVDLRRALVGADPRG